MKVTIIQSCLVPPAEKTFKGSMALTESDQIGVFTHVPLIYFYRRPNSSSSLFKTLHASLSKVLVHFYPLAGRLRWLDGAHLELDCNAKGAHLVEAYSDTVLNDLGDFTPSPHFHHLYPQIDYASDDIPVMAAQLTRFRCGGITLSYGISHAVADGRSMVHFYSEWARSARGEPMGSPPVLDRTLLRARESPSPAQLPQFGELPLLLNQIHDDTEIGKKEALRVMLKVSKCQVEFLRKEAGGAYSRYEVTAGHIWRCACRARRHADEQPTGLSICVDFRRRLRPPLPENYFGNAIVDVVALSLSGEVVGRPLSFACGKIREAIERVTSEYVYSEIEYVKSLKDLKDFQDKPGIESYYKNPNISVLNWLGLPLGGLDFGWGKEVFMSPRADEAGDGNSLIYHGYDGGFILQICLQIDYIHDFKKFFYQSTASLI